MRIGNRNEDYLWGYLISTRPAATSVFMNGLIYIDLSNEIRLKDMNSLEGSPTQASAGTYINVKNEKRLVRPKIILAVMNHPPIYTALCRSPRRCQLAPAGEHFEFRTWTGIIASSENSPILRENERK